MGPNEMLEPPMPAIRDVERDEFKEFEGTFIAIKREVAEKAMATLCNLHGVKNEKDLVTMPFPHAGPMSFIEDAEDYRFLTNYEQLVLQAVESNALAAILFLERFERQEFIAMEFFDVILNEAIRTAEKAGFEKENLPYPNTNWEQGYQEKIDKLTHIKTKVRQGAATNEWSHIKDLPGRFKFAAAQLPEELIDAIETVIEHYKRVLQRLRELFAK